MPLENLFSDDLNNSVYVCENRCGSEFIANQLLKGMIDIDQSGAVTRQAGTKDLDFSFSFLYIIFIFINFHFLKNGNWRKI
jgi:hypothetical protein